MELADLRIYIAISGRSHFVNFIVLRAIKFQKSVLWLKVEPQRQGDLDLRSNPYFRIGLHM